MRLRDANKLKHEKAVVDELLENLNIRPSDGCDGDPNKKEPDRLYKIDGKIVGVEVVTAYYSEGDAKMDAEIAAEKPLAPDETRAGEVIGGPDEAICDSIQENLDEKCDKGYSGTDETWLCINVDAAITEIEIIKNFIADELEVPDNEFDRIYLTVRKPEAEGPGLKVIRVK